MLDFILNFNTKPTPEGGEVRELVIKHLAERFKVKIIKDEEREEYYIFNSLNSSLSNGTKFCHEVESCLVGSSYRTLTQQEKRMYNAIIHHLRG